VSDARQAAKGMRLSENPCAACRARPWGGAHVVQLTACLRTIEREFAGARK